jgi:DNA-directed RNA polymerase specialized sigma24 family protein
MQLIEAREELERRGRPQVAWESGGRWMNLRRVTPKTRQAAGGALTDAELFALEDYELVAYIAKAKSAGNRDRAVAATHILLHKHEGRMRQRVALRLPEHLWHHAATVADWVLEKVARSALKLPLEGESIGEWVNWWTRAVNRQVISFWRSRQGQALEAEVEFPEEHAGEEGQGGRRRPNRLGEDFDVDARLGELVRDQVITRVLDGMANETHVAIIEAAIFENLPSKEVASRFETSDDNVNKIKSRFKERLKQEFQSQGIESL